MGKFKDKEKAIIREQLVREGGRLFSSFGLKKTSVEDITAACGIGKGTFYLFFKTKEELLLEILNAEEIETHTHIRKMTESGKLTVESFAAILEDTFIRFYDTSVSKTLYELDEFPLLFRKISDEQAEENYQRDMALSTFILSKLPEQKMKPEILMGLLRSIFLATLHKDIIGVEVFKDVMKLQIRYIAQGLLGTNQEDFK